MTHRGKWFNIEKRGSALGWDVYRAPDRTWAGSIMWKYGHKKPQFVFRARAGFDGLPADAMIEIAEFLKVQTKKRRKVLKKEAEARGEAS